MSSGADCFDGKLPVNVPLGLVCGCVEVLRDELPELLHLVDHVLFCIPSSVLLLSLRNVFYLDDCLPRRSSSSVIAAPLARKLLWDLRKNPKMKYSIR